MIIFTFKDSLDGYQVHNLKDHVYIGQIMIVIGKKLDYDSY